MGAGVSARTLSTKAMLRLPIVADDEGGPLPMRPKTRGECADVPRPCPFVGCRHNAFLEVNRKTGSLTFNFPGVEPEDMAPERSCTLDIADGGEVTLDAVGEVLNLTRERSRQIEAQAMGMLHLHAFKPGTVAEVLSEHAIEPDRNRPPLTSGTARRTVEAPIDPSTVEPYEDEPEAEAFIANVSFFADDEDAVCDTVWTMLTKLWRIRSKGSLAISRYRARMRLEREGKR